MSKESSSSTDIIRVLIVDDSFFMRKVIGDILRSNPRMEIVGEAQDGVEALEKIALLRPNVVTLDIEMPRMDGLEALRTIVSKQYHPSVVMVSGYTQEGSAVTQECLALGAVDFIGKPSGSFSLDLDTVQDILLAKVIAAAAADTSKTLERTSAPSKSWKYAKTNGIVLIGASTGGPAALEAILPELPASFPYPVVVAQHLPRPFTASFIARLQKTCQMDVALAEDGAALAAGTIYIAPGGTTTTLTAGLKTPVLMVRPNTADIETPPISKLMESAVSLYGDATIGIILTGMGTDGSSGMKQIKAAGGVTLVQDKATSAVYGMGRAVVEKKLADQVVPLNHMIRALSKVVAGHG
jgi:two-component system chemotaxis response regulator CheB